MIRHDMTNEAYHAHPAISSSDVKTVFNKSLAHWQLSQRRESAAFDLGSAVHALVLEPEKDLVRCGPADRRGTAWKDAKPPRLLRGRRGDLLQSAAHPPWQAPARAPEHGLG